MSKIKEVTDNTLNCVGCVFKDQFKCIEKECRADPSNPIKYIEVEE